MKILYALIVIIILSLISQGRVVYGNTIVSASAQIAKPTDYKSTDLRVIKLTSYLTKHKSPLAEHAEDFVKYADEYDLDWRLVPAISGVESTFGKRIPYNSFNAYGWANGKYAFKSWDESIKVVSQTLREKYLNRGATTINKIARRYAPPSTTWAGNVKFFMNEIDSVPVDFDL